MYSINYIDSDCDSCINLKYNIQLAYYIYMFNLYNVLIQNESIHISQEPILCQTTKSSQLINTDWCSGNKDPGFTDWAEGAD